LPAAARSVSALRSSPSGLIPALRLRERSQRRSRHSLCRQSGGTAAVPRVVLMHGTTLRSADSTWLPEQRGEWAPCP
jgi:hypothetical protein